TPTASDANDDTKHDLLAVLDHQESFCWLACIE
ncbi:hypothetical protein D047_0502B, partial [Vibrio parahaemolyticus VPTS-2010_2]